MRLRSLCLLIAALYLAGMAALGGGLVWRIMQGPLALTRAAPMLNWLASQPMTPYRVTFVAPRLSLAPEGLTFAAEALHLSWQGEVQLVVQELSLVPSVRSLVRDARFLPRELRAARAILVSDASLLSDAPPPQGQPAPAFPRVGLGRLLENAWQSFGQFRERSFLAWLDYMDVAEIRILERTADQDAGQDAGQDIAADGAPGELLPASHVRFRRGPNKVELSAIVQRPQADQRNRIALTGSWHERPRREGTAWLPPGGTLRLEIDDWRPRRFADVLPELPALAALDFPVNATLVAQLNGEGQIQEGRWEHYAAAGQLRLAQRTVPFAKMEAQLAIDFLAQRAELTHFLLLAEETVVSLQGTVDYVTTPQHLLDFWRADVRGRDIRLVQEALSGRPIVADELALQFGYDPQAARLTIDGLRMRAGEGTLHAAGDVMLVPRGAVELEVRVDKMAARYVRSIKLLTARTRRVIDRFVTSARIAQADLLIHRRPPTSLWYADWLATDQPSPSRIVVVEGRLDYDDAEIAWQPGLPPVEGARGRILFLPHDIRLTLDEGAVRRPSAWAAQATDDGEDIPADGEDIKVSQAALFIASYRVDGSDGVMEMQLDASARAAAEMLASDAVQALKDVPLDVEATQGRIVGSAELFFPDIRAFRRERLGYKIRGASDNMAAQFYDRYRLRANYVRLFSDNTHSEITGQARLNGANGQIRWHYNHEDKQAQFHWGGRLTRADLERMQWSGLAAGLGSSGAIGADLFVEGREHKIEHLRVQADLGPVRVAPAGWEYVKPAGRPARLALDAQFAPAAGVRGLTFSWQAGADRVEGRAQFSADGTRLMQAELSPLRLAPYYDANVRLAPPEAQAPRRIQLSAESLHLAGLTSLFGEGRGGNGWLGENFDIIARVKTLHGQEDADFRDVRLNWQQRRGRAERVRLAAAHAKDGELDMRLERVSRTARRLRGFITRPDHALRALNARNQLRGGEFSLDVELWDQPRRAEDSEALIFGRGRAHLSDFHVVEVPLLARLLTFASLGGIVQTLRRDGVHFQHLNASFDVHRRGLFFENSNVSGESLAISFEGGYDYARRRSRFVGTLIPANAVNGLLRRIPLVGRILVGGEDDGIIGIRYALRGDNGKNQISINPLTVVTPSLFRRMLTFIF